MVDLMLLMSYLITIATDSLQTLPKCAINEQLLKMVCPDKKCSCKNRSCKNQGKTLRGMASIPLLPMWTIGFKMFTV